ncbi:MAG: hypothetical protein R2860_02675 [Desulfobacterales bacterium]
MKQSSTAAFTVIAMGKTEGLVELEKILRPGTGKQAGHESG